MTTVTIEEAQAKLSDLIHNLTPGEELVITEKDQPIAKLIPSRVEKPRPLPGRANGMLTILVEDDEHLKGFAEYMLRTSWPILPDTAASPRPGPGLCKGAIVYMAPDFDAPLEDLKEYME